MSDNIKVQYIHILTAVVTIIGLHGRHIFEHKTSL